MERRPEAVRKRKLVQGNDDGAQKMLQLLSKPQAHRWSNEDTQEFSKGRAGRS